MTLLFFSFLDVRVDRSIFAWQQWAVAGLLPLIGLGVYFLGRLYDENMGLTLLLMGLAPTAVISPVLAALMRRRAGYMVGAIIVTHAVFAGVLPLLLPRLLGIDLSLEELGRLVFTVFVTVAGPLVLGQLVRRGGGALLSALQTVKPYVFTLFLSNVAVAAGSLSYYLRYESSTPWSFVAVAAVGVGLLIFFNFWMGSRLAPAGHRIEGSLLLGRKNTLLSIWIALEYINPLTVLAPMLYILLQNVFVAGQILYVQRKDAQLVAVPAEA